MAANSTVQGPIWSNFEPIGELMGVHVVVCKNEEDLIKRHWSGKSMGIFKMLKGSYILSPWSDPVEFQTHPSF